MDWKRDRKSKARRERWIGNEIGRARLGGGGGLGTRQGEQGGEGEVDWERDRESKAKRERWIGNEIGRVRLGGRGGLGMR